MKENIAAWHSSVNQIKGINMLDLRLISIFSLKDCHHNPYMYIFIRTEKNKGHFGMGQR